MSGRTHSCRVANFFCFTIESLIYCPLKQGLVFSEATNNLASPLLVKTIISRKTNGSLMIWPRDFCKAKKLHCVNNPSIADGKQKLFLAKENHHKTFSVFLKARCNLCLFQALGRRRKMIAFSAAEKRHTLCCMQRYTRAYRRCKVC